MFSNLNSFGQTELASCFIPSVVQLRILFYRSIPSELKVVSYSTVNEHLLTAQAMQHICTIELPVYSRKVPAFGELIPEQSCGQWSQQLGVSFFHHNRGYCCELKRCDQGSVTPCSASKPHRFPCNCKCYTSIHYKCK